MPAAVSRAGWSCGEDSPDIRQNAPRGLWHIVALERPPTAPQTWARSKNDQSRRWIVKTFLSIVFAAALLIGTELSGQSKSASIQGVWRAVEVTLTGPGARTIRPSQPNLIIISGKHYSRVEDQSERPRSIPADLAKASADELRAVWGPFVGEAGTYEVTGNVITMRPIVAKNPAAMVPGAFITYS